MSLQRVHRALITLHKAAALALLIIGALAGIPGSREHLRPQIARAAGFHTSSDHIRSMAWWRRLQDSMLQDLVRAAVKRGKDLGLAVARIEEARATRRSYTMLREARTTISRV